MPLRIILLGPPGSGKSTLTRSLLNENSCLSHFAVRVHFAQEIKFGTDLGVRAQPFADQHAWLPDELVIEAVQRKFFAGDFEQGFIFEGLPGNAKQAFLLHKLLQKLDLQLSTVLYLDASDDICVERANRRRVCTTCDGGVNQVIVRQEQPEICAICGSQITVRPDDYEEAFRKRLAIHRAMAEEIMDYYEQNTKIFHLNGLLTSTEVFAQANRCIGMLGESI